MKKIIDLKNIYIVFASIIIFLSGCSPTSQIETSTTTTKQSSNSWVNLDTVKAGKFDTGKMWTFDYPPKDYFKSEYNFTATDEWLNKVRMSALRFANYCSASFVSEDGLVMTNHHCARQSVTQVTKEGEDLHENGFIANTLDEERKVPGLFVDQLVLIKDVTSEVQYALDTTKNEAEKTATFQKIKSVIEKRFKEETKLECQLVTYYNGGKYSLYGFKRYKDVRLVFAPETQLGFFGGDPDNFTYPRYALDCSFFRVYDDNGKPLKTDNFFKWSPSGASEGEPVFVVGNPGRTSRLNTIAQLEYNRDVRYPVTVEMLNGLVHVYTEYIKENPDKAYKMQDQLFGISNSQKATIGILKGLRDPVFMQKKRDFELKFKNAVLSNSKLAEKYGKLWDQISDIRSQIKLYAFENNAFQLNPFSTSKYFSIASDVIKLAKQLQLTEDKRESNYKGTALDTTKMNLFPKDFDFSMAKKMLAFNLKMFSMLLGENHDLVKNLTGGKKGNDALEYCLNKTALKNSESLIQLINKSGDAILTSNDPFINFVLTAQEKSTQLRNKINDLIAIEGNYIQQLGRALFEVYGTSIPPDATFSLRLADGIVSGYDYNGTVAPVNTTFYGMYDRYHSFRKEFPFNLPKRWEKPSAEFDLETPMVFISTNDIIGGNSGSPVINRNAEIVGLAFDGNIESLPGEFIFDTTANRTVSVHSAGMIEAIQDLYKVSRLSKELRAGKIVE